MSTILDFSSFWWELTIWENEDRFQKLSTLIINTIHQTIKQTEDEQLSLRLVELARRFVCFSQSREPVEPATFFANYEDFEGKCNQLDMKILYTALEDKYGIAS